MNYLGQNVRNRRLAMNLSQEALAEKLQIHQTYVANIENGHKTPSLGITKRFADFFGVSIDEMMAAYTEPEPTHA